MPFKTKAEQQEYDRQRYQLLRDVITERVSLYSATRKQEKRLYDMAYRSRKRQQLLERARTYQRNHRKEASRRNREWRRKNPMARIRQRVYTARRRSRLLGMSEHFSNAQWIEICERFGYRCPGCGKRKRLGPDHIIPLSKGGTDDIGNIQPLCLPCNIAKGNRIIVCFLPWRKHYA